MENHQNDNFKTDKTNFRFKIYRERSVEIKGLVMVLLSIIPFWIYWCTSANDISWSLLLIFETTLPPLTEPPLTEPISLFLSACLLRCCKIWYSLSSSASATELMSYDSFEITILIPTGSRFSSSRNALEQRIFCK